ncbi:MULTISPECIES: hypothetical protein [Streptomyces]|uniref:Uncharacterized protein n=2 Tax=Streptomyces TaxID=1883 RepID=A0A2U9PDU7_STRAS|nr:hypothetical protein [Streptomyces actuosus]AWT47124.1 hypothetical protein DMT42_35995 [Streptomyces actuosus]MBM4823683.1 hypothetical protein [Streptomyces actuosus]
MERINTYLAKHLWAQMLLSVLAASVLIMVVFPGRSFLSVVVRTAVMSAGGIAVVAAARRKEKRASGGSTDRMVALDRKLRKGDVPTDPEEREAMRGLVEQRLHRTRHRVLAQVGLTVLFGAVVAATAVTAGPRQTVGLTVLSVVFLGWCFFYGNRNHRRLLTMRRALSADTAARRT